MLKYRILTAIILIPLLVFIILKLPIYVFEFLLLAIIGLSAWEWANLIPLKGWIRALYVLLIIFIALLVTLIPVIGFVILVMGLLTVFWALGAIIRYESSSPPLAFQFSSVRFLVGIFILIPCWLGILILFSSHCYGPLWLIYALAVIFSTDTGAYFVGRLWGRRSLTPKVSPKKTWEGFWGGLVCATIVAILLSFILTLTVNARIGVIILAILMGLISTVGDLLVSLVKRLSGVKDSGMILPGHGGILDRLDSIAAAVILFSLGLIILNIC